MPDPVFIEVVTSPNCVHSPRAMKVAKRAVTKRHDAIILREISIATEEGMQLAQAFEVKATPTIAINGRVAFVGVPTMDVMDGLITATLQKEKERNSYFF